MSTKKSDEWTESFTKSFFFYIVTLYKKILIHLRGRVKFPIGGIREECITLKPASRKAGLGEIPRPTV